MLKFLDILMLFSLFCFSLFSYQLSAKKSLSFLYSKLTFLIFLFLIVMVYSLRDLGLDLEDYRDIYDNAEIAGSFSESRLSRSIEIAWKVIILLFNYFNLSFYSFLFITSLIPFFLISYITNKQSVNRNTWLVIISFYMFFLFFSLDAIRAFCASAFVMCAVYNFSQKKYKSYVFFSLLSICFHNSAVIALFIPLLAKVTWRIYHWVLFTLIVASISVILRLNISDIDFNSLDIARSDNVIQNILWKLSYYLFYYNKGGYEYLNITHYVLHTSMLIIPFFIYLLLNLQLWGYKTENLFHVAIKNIYINSFIIYAALIFLGVETLANRMFSIVNLSIIFVLPHVLNVNFDSCFRWLRLSMIFIIVFNIIITILYQAGLHQPLSPFFINI